MNHWVRRYKSKLEVAEVRFQNKIGSKFVHLPAEFVIVRILDAVYGITPITIYHCEELEDSEDERERLLWKTTNHICYNDEEHKLMFTPVFTASGLYAFATQI